jgi:hypothetical protein
MRTFQPRIAVDQVTQYYASLHGKKLREGNEHVADCVSCHSAHNILPIKDPRSSVYALNIPQTCNKCHGDTEMMEQYNLSTNQFEEYSSSVHGEALLVNRDIGAPACNDCHGNHGATPPGLTSVSHVCGTCHINNMEYFNKSIMAKAFEEMDFHGCEQCHGYHSVQKTNDDMIGTGETSTCIDCHDEGDQGFESSRIIKSYLDDLTFHYDSAESKLREVRKKGMNDIQISFLLKDAKQKMIQTRTLIHTFDSKEVSNESNEGIGLSKKALKLSDEEIDDYYTRRNGFAAATVAFVILALALFFKIKSMEK